MATISGDNGPNTIDGTASDDILNGLGGDDILNGLGGNDSLDGGSGNDFLNGGPGADTLTGGLGNDRYYNVTASDVIVESAGEGGDWVSAKDSYTLGAGVSVEAMNTVNGSALTAIDLTGNEFNQGITGNDGSNVLSGLGGTDVLSGLGGDDILNGGAGNDKMDGGAGSDTASYSDASGAVTVSLDIAGAQDTLGAGTDTLTNIENLAGSAFDDTLTGDGSANMLSGLAGNDMLSGLAGNDVLQGGAGNDALDGGADSDTASYSDAAGAVTVSLNIAGAQDTLGAGTDTLANIENLAGSAFGDTLTGDASANIVSGLGGNDVLSGLGGDDTLDGGTGDDFLMGGPGSDTLIGGGGNDRYYNVGTGDVIVEAAGSGGDWVSAKDSYTLGAGVSVEALNTVNGLATSAIDLTGNEFGQAITGNDGNNALSGLGGDDTLNGLGGDDSLDGGDGIDTALFAGSVHDYTLVNAGGGNWTVTQNSSGDQDSVTNVENLHFDDAVVNGIANNAPIASADVGSADEDTGLTVNAASGLLSNDSDFDGDSLSVSAVDGGTVGTAFALASGALLTVDADGSYTYDTNGQFEALRPGQTATDSFSYTVSDGHGGTDTATATITINGENEAPVGADDTYNGVTGNTPYSVDAASGVLANDSDPDQPHSGLSVSQVNGTDISSGSIAVTGGTVAMGADGSFTFIPTAGFTGPASFTYTVTDADGGTDTATATINVTGLVWYVDASYDAGTHGASDGTYLHPFTDLTQLNGGNGDGSTGDDVDGSNDTIFVYNSSTYTGGIALETGQVLYGDSHTLTVNGIDIGTGSSSNSTINHSGIGVTLASGNTIDGINLNGTSASAVGIQDGNATAGTLNVTNSAVSGQGQIIDVDQGGTLNVTLNNASSSGSSVANGGVIDLTGVSGSFTVTGALTINGTQAEAGIDISNNTNLTSAFQGLTTVNTGAQQAVNLASDTGGSTSFTGGLDIDTTSGTAIAASGTGGTLTISGTTNSIQTTTGQAVDINGVASGGITFHDVGASGQVVGHDVISLVNAGSGGFTITGTGTTNGSGGTLNGASGTDGNEAQGVGIYINNTSNISLSNMNLAGTYENYGIRGYAVSNLLVKDSNFTGQYGTTNAGANIEGTIRFDNLTGAATFKGDSIGGGYTDNVRIDNTVSGGTLNLTFEDDGAIAGKITANDATNGNNGITVINENDSNLFMLVNGIDFTDIHQTGINTRALGTSNQELTFENSTFTHPDLAKPPASTGGGAIDIGGTGGGSSWSVDYSIVNNQVTGAQGTAIAAQFVGKSGVAHGFISGNTVGTPGTAGYQGDQAHVGVAQGGAGISVSMEQDPTADPGSILEQFVTIQNNTLADLKDGFGIRVRSANGQSDSTHPIMEVTITGNVVEQMSGNVKAGLYMLAGGNDPDYGTIGADVRNNTFDVSGAAANKAYGPIYMDQIAFTNSYYYLPGYTGTQGESYGGNAGQDLTAFFTNLAHNNTLINSSAPITGDASYLVWAQDAMIQNAALQTAQTGSNTQLPPAADLPAPGGAPSATADPANVEGWIVSAANLAGMIEDRNGSMMGAAAEHESPSQAGPRALAAFDAHLAQQGSHPGLLELASDFHAAFDYMLPPHFGLDLHHPDYLGT